MDSMTEENDPYADEHVAGVEQEKRAERDRLLRDSDFTQVADAPVNREAWAIYRQQLRDLPAVTGWPFVDFPESPQ